MKSSLKDLDDEIWTLEKLRSEEGGYMKRVAVNFTAGRTNAFMRAPSRYIRLLSIILYSHPYRIFIFMRLDTLREAYVVCVCARASPTQIRR